MKHQFFVEMTDTSRLDPMRRVYPLGRRTADLCALGARDPVSLWGGGRMKLYPDRKRTRATRIFWMLRNGCAMLGSQSTPTLAIPQSALTPQGKNPFLCKVMMLTHLLPSVANSGTATRRYRWMCVNWLSPNHIQTFGVNHAET